MKNLKRIAIWIPLTPNSSWRGEGIAQTLENILKRFSSQIEIQILVSNSHYWDVQDELGDYPNIFVKPMTIRSIFFARSKPKKPRSSVEGNLLLMLEAGFSKSSLVINLKRLKKIALNLHYITILAAYTFLQKTGLIFRGVDIFWSPSPAIPFSENLRGVQAASFWDPFVFEYREFEGVAPYLAIKVLKLLNNSKIIFTQSAANFYYLTGVMKISPNKVVVINNGAPDYSKYIQPEMAAKRADFKGDISKEFRKKILDELLGSWNGQHSKKIFNAFINCSVVYRLSMRINDHSKILMVSTQDRPYKGMDALFELYDRLLRDYPEHDFLFILTCKVPERIRKKYTWFSSRAFELTRVSNEFHAHLYLLSDLVLHPSFSEGGMGAYPQYEGASIGIPSVINEGRHLSELIDKCPAVSRLATDFTNLSKTVKLIIELISNEESRALNITATQLSRVDWSDAALSYEKSFIRL
jgi:glycosyltransferase involved in cell wall biosynthesis